MVQLPIALFPNIAPPEIQLSATYAGADALTVEQSVATPIEQQMSGVDDMIYMYSINANNGTMTLTRRLRRHHRRQHRPDPGADALLAGGVAAAARRAAATASPSSRSTTSPLALFSPLLAERHLRRALPHQLRLHQHQRPDDARPRRRPGARSSAPASTRMRFWVRPDTLSKLSITITEILDAIEQAEHREPGRPDRRRAGAARARSSPTRCARRAA